MTNRITELFGIETSTPTKINWGEIASIQHCPFLGRKCLKVRKSQPHISIGTCSVRYGKGNDSIIICPFRLQERNQIFTDCLHLLTLHEPGNQLHVVTEIAIPGGSVDYFLVSARNSKIVDFVGIELQTLDTTGTLWPARERFLQEKGLLTRSEDTISNKGFGINWKMTAKTTLIQLHHKIETFENINKQLVLVIQDRFLKYMRKEFRFDHLQPARLGDPMHIHAYALEPSTATSHLELKERISTDMKDISICLGMKATANVAVENIIRLLESKISHKTLFTL
ncbi:MAG: hypothetical protein HYR55_00515 [Acidobacteria bacterium]|nr:hypothetical protein [Acidobacteriota bacterium]MBI3656612.1 hypothetical protein [Acidobacteriota bacterium]